MNGNSHLDNSVEDIQRCARAGRIPRAHGPYQILVGDENLKFTLAIIEEPEPTGRQILAGGGLQPEDDFVLFLMLCNGAIEEVRPDEHTDLRRHGLERFLAFRTDRILRFFVNGREFEWAPRISGYALKFLAGVDPATHDVFLKCQGEVVLVEDTTLFDLTQPDVEHFFTAGISLQILVNAEPIEVHRRSLSFEDVVRLAYPEASFAENIGWTVTYSRGPSQNTEGGMVMGQTLILKQGMVVNVRCTDRS